MPSLATYAKVIRRQPPQADQQRAVVLTAGLFWSVTGEFSTPAPGCSPAFIASDIRLVNDDGSETADMLDLLADAFVSQIEEQAAESVMEDRRAAA
ncbi:hypothetical protein HTY52_08095 [Cupriavidus taiwanensis]|uniref:hypothetical protein n=1 Tax=Cupriavidus taiwanensis TaxID=164546 RepID=UPI001571921A|nr:hypothetical protein [Cupriavidus taiwanensis]NSX14031.1 hypothetical protein [Cupriavidus taiwanensis]